MTPKMQELHVRIAFLAVALAALLVWWAIDHPEDLWLLPWLVR